MDAAGHGIPPPLGPSRPFRLMARVDPVMGDAGCDRRYFYMLTRTDATYFAVS
jgi:hypothetical protein